jgi:hypothetical protein
MVTQAIHHKHQKILESSSEYFYCTTDTFILLHLTLVLSESEGVTLGHFTRRASWIRPSWIGLQVLHRLYLITLEPDAFPKQRNIRRCTPATNAEG